MALSIQVDYRESGLCKELDKLGVEYTKHNLVVGDIAYVSGTEGSPIFFCERKTYEDLNGSIVSGRYKDQRARLKDSGVPFVFILEGPNRPRLPQNAARTLGALENLAVRHQVGVIPTLSLAETAKCVVHLKTKLGDSPVSPPAAADNASSGLIVHRKTLIMGNIFANQLTAITGVSETGAKAIMTQYPTMAALMGKYAALETEVEKESLLKDIPINARRLGPVLSKRIYRAHHGLDL